MSFASQKMLTCWRSESF